MCTFMEIKIDNIDKFLMFVSQIFLAEIPSQKAHVVLDTHWLSYHIIGPTFAEDKDFKDDIKLPNSPFYSEDELKLFYADQADFQTLSLLLQSLELMVKGGEKKYIIPAKLPQSTKNPSADMSFGMCVRCVDNTMFAPIVLPAVQVRIFRDISSKGKLVTSDYVKVALEVDGLVWQNGSNDAINFAVKRESGLDENGYEILNKIQELIILTLADLSPGTKVEIGKIKPILCVIYIYCHFLT